jgi:hypothetical protein
LRALIELDMIRKAWAIRSAANEERPTRTIDIA